MTFAAKYAMIMNFIYVRVVKCVLSLAKPKLYRGNIIIIFPKALCVFPIIRFMYSNMKLVKTHLTYFDVS